MTMTRLLTATALVALLAGPVAAQTMNQPSSGQASDAEGQTPATDDTTTTTQPATTTPPVAPGDRTTTGDSSMSSMPSQTSQTGSMNQGSTNQGSMSQGSMGQGSTNAGGAQGSTSAGGSMGQGSMNAGGSMGATASAGGLMTSMNGGVRVTSNAPIPDTAENRARYGQPESSGGKSVIGEGPVTQLRANRGSRSRPRRR